MSLCLLLLKALKTRLFERGGAKRRGEGFYLFLPLQSQDFLYGKPRKLGDQLRGHGILQHAHRRILLASQLAFQLPSLAIGTSEQTRLVNAGQTRSDAFY